MMLVARFVTTRPREKLRSDVLALALVTSVLLLFFDLSLAAAAGLGLYAGLAVRDFAANARVNLFDLAQAKLLQVARGLIDLHRISFDLLVLLASLVKCILSNLPPPPPGHHRFYLTFESTARFVVTPAARHR